MVNSTLAIGDVSGLLPPELRGGLRFVRAVNDLAELLRGGEEREIDACLGTIEVYARVIRRRREEAERRDGSAQAA